MCLPVMRSYNSLLCSALSCNSGSVGRWNGTRFVRAALAVQQTQGLRWPTRSLGALAAHEIRLCIELGQ
jgi:hypothetical protein